MKKNRQQEYEYVTRKNANPHSGSRRNNRRMGHTGIAAVLLLLILVAVWLIWPHLPGNTPVDTEQTTQTENAVTSQTSSETAVQTTSTTAFTEPTTEATTEPITEDPTMRQERLTTVIANVEALLESKTGRFAVFYHNLETDETWNFQDDQPFVAASSIKLGINLILYQQIAAGEASFDEILTYDNRTYPTGDFEPGTGTIQNLANGSQLTLRETAGLSIRISDNSGVNMIIRRLGGIDSVNEQLNKISSIVDYRQPVSYKNYAGQTSSGRHRTSARDLGSHAVELYNSWLDNPEVFQPLIDDLIRTEFDFGIQKGIPDSIDVAHKIGTNGIYSTENDVGIVFASEPFVLCVMTEMASAAEARTLQADIAALFYEFSSYNVDN